MENIIYTGFFVNQKEVLEQFPVDTNKYPNVFGHHCTHIFKPTDDEIAKFKYAEEDRWGVQLPVFTRLSTEKADILILSEGDGEAYSMNKYAHITLATAEGVKPFVSNQEILDNESVIQKVDEYAHITLLNAYPGLYTSNGKVKRLGQAIVVDIDRTLCNIIENDNGKKRSPYHWDRVEEDIPIEAMCKLVRKLQDDYHIVLLTGRSEDAREGTKKWLKKNHIHYDKLLMKASGSYEQSAITKYESYVNDIKDEYDVAFAIDDDQRIVEMWQKEGIICLKV